MPPISQGGTRPILSDWARAIDRARAVCLFETVDFRRIFVDFWTAPLPSRFFSQGGGAPREKKVAKCPFCPRGIATRCGTVGQNAHLPLRGGVRSVPLFHTW